MAKQALTSAGKQLIWRREGGGGEGKGSASPANSPPPIGPPGPLPPLNHTPISKATTTGSKEPRKGRGRIIGDVSDKEMKNNPKVREVFD